MKKGVTLYLTILILVALTTMTIALSQLITIPMKTTRELPFSVQALHAADTGIEKVLYEIYSRGGGLVTSTQSYSENLTNESRYEVTVCPAGTNNCLPPTSPFQFSCPSSYQFYCIKSIGTMRETTRVIEASY